MGIAAWPGALPDFLPPTVMNFLGPAYSATATITNLDSAKALFVSFHPGVPPTVILPQKELSLSGSGIPEFFIGCPDANPWFTICMSIVNSA
jgi:hypothetical protein